MKRGGGEQRVYGLGRKAALTTSSRLIAVNVEGSTTSIYGVRSTGGVALGH